MDTISTINLARMRNNEHAQFHTSVIAEIETVGADTLGIAKLLPNYIASLNKEQRAIDVENGSRHTVTILQLDAHRDNIFRSLQLTVKAKRLSYIPEEREAAETIYRIIKQAGNLRKKDYNEETDAIRSLLTQLRTGYAAEIQTLGIIEILAELEKSNNTFTEHFDVRADEISARPDGNARVARIETDAQYRAVTLAIQGLALVNDTPEYANVINRINYLVDYYKNALSFRQGTAKDDDNDKQPENPKPSGNQ